MPNTTPIPHVVFRRWLPVLKDVELRVLLIVADQTLGWEEDPETGMRKREDWISQGQLVRRVGRSASGIRYALQRLVDGLGIVQARDRQGSLLHSPELRARNGSRIYYRLDLSRLAATPAESAGVKMSTVHPQDEDVPPQKVRGVPPQKVRATKETVLQKLIPLTPRSGVWTIQGGRRADGTNPRALGTSLRQERGRLRAEMRTAVSSCPMGCSGGFTASGDTAVMCSCLRAFQADAA